jgi:type II secretory pathway pseudopilin PulG
VVELVIVMVLLGILAANAMPRFVGASRFEEMGFADAAAAAARAARQLALSASCDTLFSIDAAGYALFQRATSCSSGTLTRPVNRPGGEAWAQAAPAGVAVSGLAVFFDAQGRPLDAASGSLLTSAASFSIGARTIVVEAETGLVHTP